MRVERCAQMPECGTHPKLADALGHDEQGHRILHAVTHAGITSCEQLAKTDDADLMDVPNLGRSRIALIRERLADLSANRREPRLLFPGEAAAILRVTPHTVKKWADAGKLTPERTRGGHRRYREAEVRALLRREAEVRALLGFPAETAEQPAPAQDTGDPAERGYERGRAATDAVSMGRAHPNVRPPP